MKLKTSLIIASLLLIALGFSSCGNQPANNANKTNSNSNVGNTNANSATTVDRGAAAGACNGTKDTAIIDAMKAAIKPGSPLHDRKRHYNFHVSGCSVVLAGYVDDIRYFKQLYDLAAKTPEVKSVDVSGLWLTQGDAGNGPVNDVCPGNGVPCGDICLPEGQTCNTKDIDIVPLGTPKPTGSRTP